MPLFLVVHEWPANRLNTLSMFLVVRGRSWRVGVLISVLVNAISEGGQYPI
jgi:hypothetical protein